MTQSKMYRGFTYWKVADKLWRIQFPGGHKTPPAFFDSEESVKVEIDDIIKKLMRA